MKKSKLLVLAALTGLVLTGCKKPVTPDPTPVDPEPVDPTPVDPTPVDPTPDWTKEIKDAMTECLGFVLPYVDMGTLEVDFEDADYYGYYIYGDYNEALVESYGATLKEFLEAKGWEEAEAESEIGVRYVFEVDTETTYEYYAVEFSADQDEDDGDYNTLWFTGSVDHVLTEWPEEFSEMLYYYCGITSEVLPFVPGVWESDLYYFAMYMAFLGYGEISRGMEEADYGDFAESYAAALAEAGWKYDEKYEAYYIAADYYFLDEEDALKYDGVCYLDFGFEADEDEEGEGWFYVDLYPAQMDINTSEEWPAGFVHEFVPAADEIVLSEEGASYEYVGGYTENDDVAAQITIYPAGYGGEEVDTSVLSAVGGLLAQLSANHYTIYSDDTEEGELFHYYGLNWNEDLYFIVSGYTDGSVTIFLMEYDSDSKQVESIGGVFELINEMSYVPETLKDELVLPNVFEEGYNLFYALMEDDDANIYGVRFFALLAEEGLEEFAETFASAMDEADYDDPYTDDYGYTCFEKEIEEVGAIHVEYKVDGDDAQFVTFYVYFDVVEQEVPPVAESSIKAAYEAAAALSSGAESSQTYTFSGVVTGTCGKTFFIQDGDYGMQVYNVDASKITGTVAVGREVEVTATVTNYNGAIETKNVTSVTVGEDGELPEAVKVTSAEQLATLRQNILVDLDYTLSAAVTNWSSDNAPLAKGKIGSDSVETTLKFDKFGYNADQNEIVKTAAAGDTLEVRGAIATCYVKNGAAGNANQVVTTYNTLFAIKDAA